MNIAYFQQDIIWETPKLNYRKVEEAFSRLSMPVDVLVVPETFSTGFSDRLSSFAEDGEGETLQFAREMALRHDALFVGTWVVRAPDGSIYNRLHWVRPDGTYGTYDKAHTFRMSSEYEQLKRGTCQPLIEWRGWRMKPAVCYDLRFPKWLRNGVENNSQDSSNPVLDYDVLLVCANWPASRYEAWTTLLKARAIENLCYVVGVNRVGVDGLDIPYSGNSAVVDFKGHIIDKCSPDVDEASVATLDRDKLSLFRQHWPFFLDFD